MTVTRIAIPYILVVRASGSRFSVTDERTPSLCSSSCDACFNLSTSSADPLDDRLFCAARPLVELEC